VHVVEGVDELGGVKPGAVEREGSEAGDERLELAIRSEVEDKV
jgi:hypothetical protein